MSVEQKSEGKLHRSRYLPCQLSRKLLLVLLLQLLCTPVFAQQLAAEYEVKAVYLYNFANYVIWPGDALADDEPFVFAIAGAPDVAIYLEILALDRTVEGRKIEVQLLEEGANAEGANVLFVGQRFPDREALLADTSSLPVLTVTEDPEQHPASSAINFNLVEDKVRFDISLANIENRGLEVSSRLLSVARQVLGYRSSGNLMIAMLYMASPVKS